MAAGPVVASMLAPTLSGTSAGVPVLLTPIHFPRARRSRHCLQALHAPPATG